MTHYMIDIETTDTKATSKVLAIAVVKFTKSEIIDTLILYPSLEEQTDRTTSMETMIFWLGYQDILLSIMKQNRKKLSFCLHQLCFFMDTPANDNKVWSKSPSFDLMILKDLFEERNLPWRYPNERDVRTAQDKLFQLTKSKIPHDPIQDAIAQVIDVQRYLNI